MHMDSNLSAGGNEVGATSSGSVGKRSGEMLGAMQIGASPVMDPSFVPVIDKLLDDRGTVRGVIENEGHTDDGRPEIFGKGPPGGFVHIYDGVLLIGRVAVEGSGEWSYVPRVPLTDGRHEISILLEDSSGRCSDYSEPYVIHVDSAAPDIPAINGVVDDEGNITGVIAPEGITDDNRPTVSGVAEPHSVVIVYDGGKEIGRASVDSEGNWSFTPEVPLKDGARRLSFMATDLAGNESEVSESFDFQVDTRAIRIRIIGAEDDAGNDVGTMFSGSVTDDTTPTLWGTATAGGLVRIYESGVLLGQTTADVDGSWEFTPGVALSKDVYKFYATVSFDFKGESAPSAPFTLTVNNESLGARGVERALDHEGDDHALAAAGDEPKFAAAELSQVLVQVEDDLFASASPSSGGSDVSALDIAAYIPQNVGLDQLTLCDFALESC